MERCESWTGLTDEHGAVACGKPIAGTFTSANSGETTAACADHLRQLGLAR